MPTKNAQGVILRDTLYLGGGYTGSSQTDLLVHAHDFTTGKWRQLPACPVKWSALSVLRNRLLLIGGREAAVAGGNSTGNPPPGLGTNKIVAWDKDGWQWDRSFVPPMLAPRISPVVVSHREHLVVAGGRKGALDYHAEVLLATAGGDSRWVCGPALPLPCLPHTSAVLEGVWYLLDQKTGVVRCVRISAYVNAVRERDLSERNRDSDSLVAQDGVPRHHDHMSHSELWSRLDSVPSALPFRIAATSSHLLSFSDSGGILGAHVFEDGRWSCVESRLPASLSTGLVLAGEGGGRGQVYVLGGQTGYAYSNASYRLMLMTHEALRLVKKSRQTRLSE